MRISIRFRDLDAPPETHARVERAVREALEPGPRRGADSLRHIA